MQPNVIGSSESKDKKMVDKVNQQMNEEDDGIMAKVIGLGLILFGLVFVVLAVAVVILSNRDAQVDESLEVPTIKAQEFTNSDTVVVKGTAEPNSSVIFFVDGEETGVTLDADEDGKFEGEIPVPEEEKVFEITAAQVSGFPLRKRSPQTDPVATIVDTTPPSTDVELVYEAESTDGTFKVSGTTEPNTVVTISDGENDFIATSDDNGAFVIENIELGAEETTFTVTLADLAGNEVKLDDKISVVFPDYDLIANGGDSEGDLNGDGVTTGPDTDQPELPEAAGELEDAMSFIFGNQLMFFFGIAAMAALMINGGLVAFKMGNKS